MKRFLMFSISLICLALPVEAYNALHEHSVHKSELHKMGTKQQIDNRQYIQYYKGKSDYRGTSSWAYSPSSSSNKNIYVKKGVKYKIDEAKQAEKLKELQEDKQEEIKKVETVAEPVVVEVPKEETKQTLEPKEIVKPKLKKEKIEKKQKPIKQVKNEPISDSKLKETEKVENAAQKKSDNHNSDAE